MNAPDKSGISKDFPENAAEWIATAGKRCTDDDGECFFGGGGCGLGSLMLVP